MKIFDEFAAYFDSMEKTIFRDQKYSNNNEISTNNETIERK